MANDHTRERELLVVEGARQHNLKGFDVEIPHERLVVVTGVSGSGKSSFAFDTCYAEGQRRYMESLSTYARQFLERMPRPDVEHIEGIQPSIALEQRNPVRTNRSTVATATEVHDHLRLLWARAGRVGCPECGRPVSPTSPTEAVDRILADLGADGDDGARAYVLFPVSRRKGERRAHYAVRMKRHGFLRALVSDDVYRLGEDELPEVAELDAGSVVVDRLALRPEDRARLAEAIETAYEHGHGHARVQTVEGREWRFSPESRCPWCDVAVPVPEPHLFSFNSPLGACESCKGFGEVLEYAESLVVPDASLTLAEGAISPWQTRSKARYQRRLEEWAEEEGVPLDVAWKDLDAETRRAVWLGEGAVPGGFPGVLGFFGRLERKRYKVGNRMLIRRHQENVLCPDCHGARLGPEARRVVLDGRAIHEVTALDVGEARDWAEELELSEGPAAACAEALRQLRFKLEALHRVGLDYVTLDRAVRTLSSGEHQRLMLAHQLGSHLTGTLYVLDEPTVGLHPRDTDRLLGILGGIAARGNTVLVVEHEPAVIRTADHVVELGPGAGEHGGELLFSGTREAFLDGGAPADSKTAGYLRGDWGVPVPEERRLPKKGWMRLRGCTGHNLRSIDFEVPLGLLVAVSGVSGSGKTTLVRRTLYPAVQRSLEGCGATPLPHEGLSGTHRLTGVALLDQEPIGKTPRSNPATFLKILGPIREVFAGLPAARREGLTKGHFSFNAKKGRCPTCKGEGQVTVEMHFLEDLHLTCEDCRGTRYKQKVLRARYKGHSIADVLALTVEEAADLFRHQKAVLRRLEPLRDVGLGYLRLGQPAPTLSGGESQRMKIAATLAGAKRGHTLYVLDEPTTGLHPWDVRVLLEVLHRLVDAGNSVLVIEHNLDLLRAADWLVDLGPEGGEAGGRIVAAGPPEEVAECEESITGRYLAGKGPGEAPENRSGLA